MSLTEIAKRLDSIATTLSIVGWTILDLDMNPVPDEWNHITKVDPESEKELPLAYPLYLSHTSAVSVGGSQDVTARNSEETFELITAANVSAFHEPSASTHVTESTREYADFLAVPEVLNGDSESLVGTLGKGIEHVRTDLGPSIVEEKFGTALNDLFGDRLGNFAAAYMMAESVFEAYIIMNTDSAAAREANVTEENLLTPQEAKERALAAEYHLESEVIYLEYSGTFGGEQALEILEAIDDGISRSRLWYGGGLDSRENATAVLDAGADAVIVGDIFHRVATLEAELFERADECFDEVPAREELQEWVATEVDDDNSAARYLSTIPTVPDPEERAVRYLTTGVEMALKLQHVADKLEDPNENTLRDELPSVTPGQEQFADVLDDDDAAVLARRLGRSLLASKFDLEIEDSVAVTHLSTEL